MRSREEKKCKKHEGFKGKIITFFMLFAPLIAIGVTCGYAMFNKNAYQSYDDQLVESSVNLDSSNVNNLYVNGQYVTYTFKEHDTQWNASFGFSEISIDLNELFNVETTWNKFYLFRDRQDILFYTTANQSYRLNEVDRNFNTFTYRIDLTVSSDKEIYNYGIATIINYTTQKVSNVFYYSIDKVQESPLFNWASDNVAYRLYHNMCTTIEVTNTFIPFMLAYWTLTAIIYILFDIEFTLLWKLHDKLHDLTDSI